LFWDLSKRGLLEAHLSDANGYLINAYLAVRNQPLQLLDRLRFLTATKAEYDNIVSMFKATWEPVGGYQIDLDKNGPMGLGDWPCETAFLDAADLILLNRMCFNGLFRVNQRGGFNVAMDPGKVGVDLVRPELITACSMALGRASIHYADFRTSIRWAGDGSILFADSPYVPARETKMTPQLSIVEEKKDSFTQYTAKGFGAQDQVDLLNELIEAKRRGAYVLATNAWDDQWALRYEAAGFDAIPFEAERNINQDGEGRQPVTEVLYVGRP